MFGEIRHKIKSSIQERIYKFLMRNTRYVWGRKPFGIEELQLLNEALVSQNLFGVDGKMVPAFEKEFAQVYGVPYAVASTSGTAAIHTALGVLDMNPGDEVITAPITDLGTVIPILSLNAIPVFADIDHTYNMDPQDVERKITERTRAIVVVHLFGNPCNMDAMLEIARKHNIPLIEDCSQSHVTEYKGKYVGTIGDIGCFSFQQSKHMTTGDGGMTITSNKAYYDKMKLYVDKGFMRKGWGTRAYGFHAPNYRMNELTAAVGRAQLKKVKAVVQKRNAMGTLLTKLLSDVPGLTVAPITEGAKHSYWLYPVLVQGVHLETFAKEMIAQQSWCAAGYTGKPIYLCSESLTHKKTYGTSQFPFVAPFASRTYEYKEGLCPRAEETLTRLVTMPWDESWSMERVEKAAAAFKSTLKKLSSKTSVETAAVVNKPASASASQNEARKVRIAIIGCGQMGQWHYEAYRKIRSVELAAFVDTDIAKANSFAKRINSNAYASYQELFQKEKLDGVSICTVPSTHKEIVSAALDAGVHVICEKPLAVSADQAREMSGKARDKNKILLTAFKFRFFDEVKNAKEILEKGTLGKVLSFRVMFGGYIDMAGTWFANKDLSGGGIIIDNGPHAFDLVRHLLGEIDSVEAQVMQGQDIPVEDTAQIYCHLKNGGRGVIDVSWTLPVPSKTYMEIYGEEGAVLLDFDGLSYKFKTWDEWRRMSNNASIKEVFGRQMVHFVEAIQGKKPSVTDVNDGILSQELIEQAYRSLKG